MSIDRDFLDFSSRKLRQLTGRIRECTAALDDGQLWRRAAPDQNAIGNLLLHLTGNVRQWIVSGVGGSVDVRVRDREFSAREGASAGELLAALEGTVDAALTAIERLSPERLSDRVRIQAYDVTVLEAIYHVVEHFSQHTGQIILLSRLLTGASPGFYRHLERPGGHSETTP